MTTVRCPNCGKENRPRAKFCTACGTPLTAIPRPEPPTRPPEPPAEPQETPAQTPESPAQPPEAPSKLPEAPAEPQETPAEPPEAPPEPPATEKPAGPSHKRLLPAGAIALAVALILLVLVPFLHASPDAQPPTPSPEQSQSSPQADEAAGATPSPAPTPTEDVPPPTPEPTGGAYTQIRVMEPKTEEGGLRFRAQPDTSAEVLETISRGEQFYLLEEKDGWGYGVYWGQLGWCSMEFLQPSDYSWGNGVTTLAVPDFLSSDQQLAFVRALYLYECLFWHNGDENTSGILDVTGVTLPCYHFHASYPLYEQNVSALFTPAMVQKHFGRYINRNGSLYVEMMGDLGVILGMTLTNVRYELLEAGDTQITFNMICDHYEDPNQTVYPIVMSKGTDGVWRFDRFAAPALGEMD